MDALEFVGLGGDVYALNGAPAEGTWNWPVVMRAPFYFAERFATIPGVRNVLGVCLRLLLSVWSRFALILAGWRTLLYETGIFVVSPMALLFVAAVLVISRVHVYSSTRLPVILSLRKRLLVRGIPIAALVLAGRDILATLRCRLPNNECVPVSNSSTYATLYLSFSLSAAMETLSAMVQHRPACFDFGFSYSEFWGVFPEARRYDKIPQDVLLTALFSVGAQIIIHIEGVFNTSRYRLFTSTVIGLSFLGLYVYLHYAQIDTTLTLWMFGTLRNVPKLVCLFVVTICYSVLWLTALLVGSPRKLNMFSVYENLTVNSSEGFMQVLSYAAVKALFIAADDRYLREALAVKLQRETWLDAIFAAEQLHEPTANPYMTEVKTYSGKKDVNPFTEEKPIQNVRGLVVRLRASAVLAKNLIFVVYQLAKHKATSWRVFGGSRQRQTQRRHESLRSQGIDLDGMGSAALRRLVEQKQIHEYIDESGMPRNAAIREPLDRLCYEALDRDVPGTYAGYLASPIEIPEIDSSPNWQPGAANEESDDGEAYEDEEDSDIEESQLGTVDLLVEKCALLVDTLSAYAQTPGNAELFRGHFSGEGAVTRSAFARNDDDGDRDKLMEVIGRRRDLYKAQDGISTCVVCMVEPRNIIVWPCRCFALCDECRVALSIRNVKECVCCRTSVSAYSRVFLP